MKIKVKCIDRMSSLRSDFLQSQLEFTVTGFTRLASNKIGFRIKGDPTDYGFSMERFVPAEEITEIIITIPDDLKYIDI